jgi:hypothetical protein
MIKSGTMIAVLKMAAGLRTHDLRAARTFLRKVHAGQPL